mgnify:CR=1 FL=1
MITFGKLDENNMVLSAITIAEKDTSDENGQIVESIGQAFCEDLTGWPAAQWVIEGHGNRNSCGVGSEWDPVNKIFWPPQVYSSWTKDIASADWISPVGPAPELTDEEKSQNKHYVWNDDSGAFELVQL